MKIKKKTDAEEHFALSLLNARCPFNSLVVFLFINLFLYILATFTFFCFIFFLFSSYFSLSCLIILRSHNCAYKIQILFRLLKVHFQLAKFVEVHKFWLRCPPIRLAYNAFGCRLRCTHTHTHTDDCTHNSFHLRFSGLLLHLCG